MADLFSVTAPLQIRFRDGSTDVMVERLQHDDGLVYFRPFWNRMPLEEGIRFVPGEVRGDGPWKVGSAVVTVLGCQGTNPEQAADFAEWQICREQLADDYPDADGLLRLAREAGCISG
ncbi:MAG: hypothetical protein R3308_11205 [Thiohalobacterales bacterium]|nr:hypothetical protein [Thiohalobacterales bacterium]